VVDERGKWQRIRDWALKDSVHAAADKPTNSGTDAGSVLGAPTISSCRGDDMISIQSSLMELEVARASSIHLPAASLGSTAPQGSREVDKPGAMALDDDKQAAPRSSKPTHQSLQRASAKGQAMVKGQAMSSRDPFQEHQAGVSRATSASAAASSDSRKQQQKQKQQYPTNSNSNSNHTGRANHQPTLRHRPSNHDASYAQSGYASQSEEVTSNAGLRATAHQHHAAPALPSSTAHSAVSASGMGTGMGTGTGTGTGMFLAGDKPIMSKGGSEAEQWQNRSRGHEGPHLTFNSGAVESGEMHMWQHRAKAAEDQLSAAEQKYLLALQQQQQAMEAMQRTHQLDTERWQSRLDLLEQSLASERILSSKAQQQLQAEMLRVRALTETEASARAAESSLR
jgi:hypothetical protein